LTFFFKLNIGHASDCVLTIVCAECKVLRIKSKCATGDRILQISSYAMGFTPAGNEGTTNTSSEEWPVHAVEEELDHFDELDHLGLDLLSLHLGLHVHKDTAELAGRRVLSWLILARVRTLRLSTS